MQDAYLDAADKLVADGIEKSTIPLTTTLHHYLALTVARYMRRRLSVDRLTLRVVEALDRRAPPGELRDLADACLLACAFFERRLRRAGGSLRHYSGMGQTAYDAANLTEQAVSFPHMRDVLVAATARDRPALVELVDAARAGSGMARAQLAADGIIAFPGRRR
ncbi:MAG TPA: hypothetical protein ENJ52_02040 [Aliiroseovarius sp.]|nr:hypothetical protein [Aliiroseovarius sp.]